MHYPDYLKCIMLLECPKTKFLPVSLIFIPASLPNHKMHMYLRLMCNACRTTHGGLSD